MNHYSFIDLISGKALAGITKIVIPKIQRDYAQGRNGQRATDVRNSFVSNLLATLTAETVSVQKLDFIYGYLREGCFEPLDGQQRLTTLFLLHWLVLPDDERSVLIAADGSPVLSYKTRPTAKDFCKFLVGVNLNSVASAFDKAVTKAEENQTARPKLSTIIRELDDYRYSWDLDPTVKSMLTMLDSMMTQFGTFNVIKNLSWSRLNNIQFNIRNLDELAQGDELYIKMNARGLELSDFDNTKAALEGDLISAELSSTVQATWQEGMDGSWIDFFWYRANGKKSGKDLTLKDITAIEDDFKTFLIRLIGLRWFERYYSTASNSYEKQIVALTDRDRMKRDSLSANLTTYLALRFKDTHSDYPPECPVIDYAWVIESLNSLLFKDGFKCMSIDSIATSVKWDSTARVSFIDSLLEGEFSYGNRLILYGMLAFTRRFPASEIVKSSDLRSDWTTWLRLIRNLVLARNSNAPIDALDETRNAMNGLNSFMDEFAEAKISEPSISMSEFIRRQSEIKGFDAEIFEEEKQKEKLRDKLDWSECLDRFENEGYLFGQLRAPLQWADGDLSKFKQYATILNQLLVESNRHILNVALLLVSDCETDNYPMRDTLLTIDNDRDRSFKRYLREDIEGIYAPALKKLADLWINAYNSIKSADGFLLGIIAEYKDISSIPRWKRQLAGFPEIIAERTRYYRIHAPEFEYLIESKREDKLWNINLCWLKKTRYKDDYFVIHNTKESKNLSDTIIGGRLVVADGINGDRLCVDKSSKPRFRSVCKGLARSKVKRNKRR